MSDRHDTDRHDTDRHSTEPGETDPGEPSGAPVGAAPSGAPTAAYAEDPSLAEDDTETPDDEILADLGGVTVWLYDTPPALVTALESGGHVITDDPEEARCVVVSTRTGRHRIVEALTVAQAFELPTAVLTHPGGEGLAVEAIRLGALAALAEGDMSGIGALARADAASSAHLIDAYESRVGRNGSRGGAATSPMTGLPTEHVLTGRLAALAADPDRPVRLMSMRIQNLQQATSRMSHDALHLLMRRLSTSFQTICGRFGQLFDLMDGGFMLVAPGMGAVDAERMGRQLATITESFNPDAHARLTLAIGHAGQECGTDPLMLRELATRAESAAALEETSKVIGAGEIVGPLATATQLEVTMRLAELGAELAADGISRDEVARVASEIAARVGLEGPERAMVRFVAHVAEIGRATAPEGCDVDAEHPVHGAKVLAATAGPEAAAAVRHQHERWDGSGTPDRLSGNAIPAPARIAAIALALVKENYEIANVKAGAGSRFDPSMVEVVEEAVRDGVFGR